MSLSAILMFHVFQIESSVSMKMSEFKSLMNLWWLFSFLLSDRVENSHWKWASFWLTCCSADWVSWRDINWSAWRCFALKFNHSLCNWLIFFFSSSFLSKVTFSCFALFLWSSCMRSQLSEFRSMKVRVFQRIKNKHKNYSSMLSLSSQMRIWVYENCDTEFMRNSTVNSQKHWVYENLYHWFSKTLSLQEFKSHTNLDISSTIRIQVTYDLQKTLHELHVISLISLTMLELSLLNI